MPPPPSFLDDAVVGDGLVDHKRAQKLDWNTQTVGFMRSEWAVAIKVTPLAIRTETARNMAHVASILKPNTALGEQTKLAPADAY